MVTLIKAEIGFDKIQQPFMIKKKKNSEKTRKKGKLLNLIKSIYQNINN